MAAANRQRSASLEVFGNEAYPLARSHSPRATIPTASLSRVAMRASSSPCWRPHGHEVPRGLPEHLPKRTESSSRPRADHRPRGRLDQSLPGREYVRRLADKSLRLYAQELLHFVRWWESIHHTGAIAEGDLSESTLLDYVRFQSSQQIG